ncbi:TIGR04372 family glycosyltransferase [Viridibacterium curvum]|uniref:TIGR04372 family glycosyltransferase n=1 Tax=Viridibacterium curvum TaxID=1101404 RepID=UPI0031EB6760
MRYFRSLLTRDSYAQVLDRGLVALAAGKYRAADRTLKRAHRMKSGETQAFANRLLALLGKGDMKAAGRVADALLGAPMPEKNSNLIAAQALEQLGRFSDAADCVARAYAADTVETSLLELVGRLYWKGGAPDRARAAWAEWQVRENALAAKHAANDTRYLGLPWVGWIGNMCHLDVYQKARMLGLMPEHHAIILAPENRIANACLLDYWKEYFEVRVESPQTPGSETPFRWFAPIHTLQLKERCMYLYDLQAQVEHIWESQSRPPLLRLKDAHHEQGKLALSRLGIPHGSWYVCLHVREQGFWQEGGSRFHLPRCADIRKYAEAIRAIVAAGGWVIRMGDPSMSRLPAMQGVVDYAHSAERSDWMDVYLAASCRFMLAGNSGLVWLAKLFGRPVVGADWLPMGPLPPTSKDIVVPKRLYSRSERRFLNFREMIHGDLAYEWSGTLYERLKLAVHDANPSVLTAAVKQMLAETGAMEGVGDQSSPSLRDLALRSGFAANCRLATGFMQQHPEFMQ